MSPTPTALGMHLCEQSIVEEHTRRVSLINCFTALRAAKFPTGPRPFWILTDLTDSVGNGYAELAIADTVGGEIVHNQSKPIRFANRLQVVQYGWHVTGCSFPKPGRYHLTLGVDGEWVGQRWLDLVSSGALP